MDNSFDDELVKLKESMEQTKKHFENIKTMVTNSFYTALREDKNIKKISETMFIINSSNLSLSSWSPEYYNTSSQISKIINILESTQTMEDFYKKLEKLVDEEKIVERSHSIRLNEVVLKILKDSLNDLKIFQGGNENE